MIKRPTFYEKKKTNKPSILWKKTPTNFMAKIPHFLANVSLILWHKPPYFMAKKPHFRCNPPILRHKKQHFITKTHILSQNLYILSQTPHIFMAKIHILQQTHTFYGKTTYFMAKPPTFYSKRTHFMGKKNTFSSLIIILAPQISFFSPKPGTLLNKNPIPPLLPNPNSLFFPQKGKTGGFLPKNMKFGTKPPLACPKPAFFGESCNRNSQILTFFPQNLDFGVQKS